MPLVNQLENIAQAVVDGVTTLSNTVTSLLQLPPVLLKSADKLVAVRIGDTITYTLAITNPNLTAMTGLVFTDALPEGCEYVADSLTLNGTPVAGSYSDETRELSYTVDNIAALGVATLTFQVTVVETETEA